MGERRRYFFGPFGFDSGTEELRREGQIVPLTPKASSVLAYLLSHAGKLASKSDLMESVWRGTHVGDAVLKVAVREIRKALGDDASEPTYIVTVHRRGYRFVAELQQAPVGAGAPATHAPRPARAQLPSGGYVPLVGREAELATLERCYAEAAAGQPRAVFLRGEAGSGKTALSRAFLERCEGARVAEGACLSRRATAEPYFALLSAVASLAGTERPDAMDAAVVGALLRHAPTWAFQLPAVVSRVDASDLRSRIAGAGQARMLRELRELFVALSAERPLVVLLEDAHLADAATLDVIEAVARDQSVGRTLLLVTYRPTTEEGSPARVDALKDSLLARQGSRFLPLPPLTHEAVERFLLARFEGLEGAAAIAQTAHARTAGNPLFLAHVAEDWAQRGFIAVGGEGHQATVPVEAMSEALPYTLRRMLESHLAALTPATQELLEAAAVATDACSSALLAAVTGTEPAAVEALVAETFPQLPILRALDVEALPDGSVSERYAFSHGLYRDVCLARIPDARRTRLHRAVGQWLEATYGDGRLELARAIASCFEHGRLPRQAIDQYLRAAEYESARLAYREASLLLARALGQVELLPDPERARLGLSIAVERAEQLIRAGDYLAALSELVDVAARAEALGEGEAEANARVSLGSIVVAWDYQAAIEHLERAVALADAAGASLLATDARGRLAYFALCQGRAAAVRPAIDQIRAGFDAPIAPRLRRRFTHRMACLPMAYSVTSRHDEARAAFDWARRDLLDHGDSYEYLLLLINGLETFIVSGRLGRAFELLDEGLTMGRQNADALAIHALACVRAHALSTVGAYDAALAVIAESRPWIQAVGVEPLGYALDALGAEAHMAAGRPQEAMRMATRRSAKAVEGRAFRVPAITFSRELTLGRAAARLGEPEAGLERLEALITTCHAIEQHHGMARALVVWARIAWGLGRSDDARRALDRALDVAPAAQLPFAFAEAAQALIELLETRGGGRRTIASLQGALAQNASRLAQELAARPEERAALLALPWVPRAARA